MINFCFFPSILKVFPWLQIIFWDIKGATQQKFHWFASCVDLHCAIIWFIMIHIFKISKTIDSAFYCNGSTIWTFRLLLFHPIFFRFTNFTKTNTHWKITINNVQNCILPTLYARNPIILCTEKLAFLTPFPISPMIQIEIWTYAELHSDFFLSPRFMQDLFLTNTGDSSSPILSFKIIWKNQFWFTRSF